MKKIFLIGMMSVCAVALTAQDNANRREGGGGGRGFNPEQRYEQLKKELNLSSKQLDSLKVAERDLFSGMRRQGQARGERPNEDAAEAKKRAEEIKKRNEQFEKRLKNFLTEEQITKYKELRNRNNRGPNQGQGERGERGERGGRGERRNN
jgi:Skp family chaperone for outer membrane proteins